MGGALLVLRLIPLAPRVLQLAWSFLVLLSCVCREVPNMRWINRTEMTRFHTDVRTGVSLDRETQGCLGRWRLRRHLELRSRGRGLGLHRGGRQFTWGWGSECSLLMSAGPPITMGPREDFGQTGLARLLPAGRTSSSSAVAPWDGGSLPAASPLSKLLGQ